MLPAECKSSHTLICSSFRHPGPSDSGRLNVVAESSLYRSIEYVGTISGDGLDYQQIVTKSGNTAMMADMRLSPLTATSLYVPLTVTAGLEKLQQAQTGATATAIATATASSTGSAQSGSGSESGSAATATSAQASSTSTANAAAPRAGRDGLLAGALAAVGLMMF